MRGVGQFGTKSDQTVACDYDWARVIHEKNEKKKCHKFVMKYNHGTETDANGAVAQWR